MENAYAVIEKRKANGYTTATIRKPDNASIIEKIVTSLTKEGYSVQCLFCWIKIEWKEMHL